MHKDAQDFQSLTEPSVPEGCRVYAIGDVHGRLDLLDELLATITDDAGRSPTSRLTVVMLGDYIDRGRESRGVIERLIAAPRVTGPLAGAEWVCLRGNHEDALLRFLDEGASGHAWCFNGGLETVRSYAGAIPEGLDHDMPALQLMMSRALPPAHLRFLSRLKVSHIEGDYLFVHAGIRPGVPIDQQKPSDLMWIRDEFLHCSRSHGKVVVHGHSQVTVPEVRENRIGIDTGAYRTGRLSCLVLEGCDQRFLATGV